MRHLASEPSNRVLVCAPSNAATNALTESLVDEGLLPRSLFRLVAIRRGSAELGRLRKYTSFNETTNEFDVPSVRDLKQFSVVVSTVDSTGVLFGIGMRGQFTHIIVDEAAQVNLTRGLVPLSLARPATAIILAGDDKVSC